MGERLSDFKKTLKDDYIHMCTKEKELITNLQSIQQKLEKVTNEKKELETVYKKLYGVDLIEESESFA